MPKRPTERERARAAPGGGGEAARKPPPPYRHCQPVTLRLLRGMAQPREHQELEDFVHDVFVDLLDPSRPTPFRGEAKPETYLAAAAIHKLQDARRRERTRAKHAPRLPPPAPPPAPDDRALQAELRRAIAEALARLPEPQREAFKAVHMRGLSYKDAAREVGCSVPSLRNRCYRARLGLRLSLQSRE